MQRRALICGISGQDGAYLARLLLSKGYEVWGTSRDAKNNGFEGLKVLSIFDKVKILSMSPEDFCSVLQVFSEVRPHEIYNLAGQSSVGLSFEQPLETMSGIASGTLNQLEAIRIVDKSIRFFGAGSSECFGDTGGLPANESSLFRPQSPYAVAKAASTWHASVYRKSYDLFACTGILFNHESPLRPERFVTKKIVSAAKRIASGSNEKLKLGNIDIRRDWGWAPEYVDAMWRMLNLDAPEDFVIATGVSQSLREFVQVIFEEAELDWREHVIADPTLLRPSDPLECIGDSAKAKIRLDWRPAVVGAEVPKKIFHDSFSIM
ncbi:GDP-mannose 4,6-dehydratase [Methyloversatilis thermotolerans]|uniref:GDP-mannose 4,6-dehydratase n=1 Tax=Methyloversatilis thermotolerans TaxID=1346290 RepID=UPI000377B757|nr:GDP-mannose 4,6-dehydratase [Methyloversatilis thermotolerans]